MLNRIEINFLIHFELENSNSYIIFPERNFDMKNIRIKVDRLTNIIII